MKTVGRPKTDNPKSEMMTVRFDTKTFEKLKIISDYKNKSCGDILRCGVEKIFEELQKEIRI